MSVTSLFMMWGLGLAGLALHLFTVLIAYEWAGFLSAMLAFAMPLLAEIYYVVKTITVTGLWLNFYTEWVLLYLAGTAVTFTMMVIAGKRNA